MRLALVVQRYGAEIAGGSEAHCREIAERLVERHDVTVLTSCAVDYVTWRNELPAGVTDVGGVTVHRFRARPRRMGRFWEVNQIALSGHGTPAEEERWFYENGPRCDGLLDHLRERGSGYDAVLFWTYRYFPSYFGLPLVADRAVLLPTAEADPAIRIRRLRELFRLPAGFLFLTPEEERLVRSAAGRLEVPTDVIGSGLDPAPEPAPAALAGLAELGLDDAFALYLGRVDHNKGCDVMFEHWLRYLTESGRETPLVVAGREAMPVPDHPAIRRLGFVSEELRQALLARARFLLMPSPFESLSLVVLESWNHARPVLVNGACAVLRGQVRRSDGGLYFDSWGDFREAADLLLDDKRTTDRLGEQGLAYVDAHYRWPVVLDKVERALEWPAAATR